MKKVYSLLLASILTLIGMDANAFTLFIEVDDISRISEITTYPAQSSNVDLSADEISVEYADDASMRYITVIAKDGKYITGYKFVDEDGRELASKGNATGKLSYITVPKEADYGKMIITTADEIKADGAIKVTLAGDPKKVNLMLNAKRSVNLKVGEQVIEYISATEGGTWYIMPVGVSTLYKVTLNGDEVKPTSSWDGAYQYTIHVNSGDEIYIETDYPDTKYTFTLSVPEGMEGIVESVTVDGNPMTEWKRMEIKIGARLVVTLNDGDYKLSTFSINGGENLVGAKDEWGIPRFINSWGTLVDGDIAIVADGTLIERPYTLNISLHGFDNIENTGGQSAGDNFMMLAGTPVGGYYFARSNNKYLSLEDGGAIKFCDDDNPFLLEVRSYSESEDIAVTVMINNETIEGQWGQWNLTFKDGDTLSIYFGVEPDGVNKLSTINYQLSTSHDLQGRPIDARTPGIHIVSGKKILVK